MFRARVLGLCCALICPSEHAPGYAGGRTLLTLFQRSTCDKSECCAPSCFSWRWLHPYAHGGLLPRWHSSVKIWMTVAKSLSVPSSSGKTLPPAHGASHVRDHVALIPHHDVSSLFFCRWNPPADLLHKRQKIVDTQ